MDSVIEELRMKVLDMKFDKIDRLNLNESQNNEINTMYENYCKFIIKPHEMKIGYCFENVLEKLDEELFLFQKRNVSYYHWITSLFN